LRRLKTDCLDLIQLHSLETCGDRMAKEETLPAFHKLQEQGKVRFTGISGRRAEALAPFVQEGLVDTVQPFGTYTLIDHSAGADLFPEAREHGIGVIMASPLWMGILADTPAHFLCERHDLLAEAERRKAEIAFLRQHDGPGGLIEPAMRFCLSCPDIAVTLTGARSVLELEQNCSFCDGRGLGQQLEERILALFHGRGLQ
jgi:L-galactose dehydrogenase